MSTFLYPNVQADSASTFDFETSLEAVYIKGIFAHLKELLGQEFSQYHFYVYSAVGANQVPHSYLESKPHKVLIYLSDELATYPVHLKNGYEAIFKCYLPYEREGDNIFPFPLGYVGDVPLLPLRSMEERGHSVFFSGCLNLNRLSLYRQLTFFKYFPFFPLYLLKRLPFLDKLVMKRMPMDFSHTFKDGYIRFTGYFRQKNVAGESYSQLLNDSKIVLCPKGFHGPETFRHYEAMRQGAVLLSERLPPTSLYRNFPGIQIENWAEGLKRANELLQKPEKLKHLASQSIEFWEKKWSEKAVADFMLAKLDHCKNSI